LFDLRNIKSIEELAKFIEDRAPQRPSTIMEVCGTHTMSIARWGIKDLLPERMRLISGPGCPVCVTDTSVVAEALALAAEPNVIFTCFGDMLRVPAGDKSLARLKSEGYDIGIVLSPMDALDIAKTHPDLEVVFLAVGFETTAPLTAAVIETAKTKGIGNFTILCAHKTMPAAIQALLAGSAIDALLCPGHVAAISGADAFSFIPRDLKRPAAISGFEPFDIMLALAYLARDLHAGAATLSNCYPRIVKPQGNPIALSLMRKVFRPATAVWRGLGEIADSGLALKEEYADFDAQKKFRVKVDNLIDNPACSCGRVLRGEISPHACPLFGKNCTPDNPAGACMVSSEGSCAAAYKYGRGNPHE
jgi:hydrogenase expression/formation protein HypD